jgi:hypothetical protein
MREPPPDNQLDRTLALGLLILLFVSSPVMTWWTSPGSAWYLPNTIWAAIICFIAWNNIRNHEP